MYDGKNGRGMDSQLPGPLLISLRVSFEGSEIVCGWEAAMELICKDQAAIGKR